MADAPKTSDDRIGPGEPGYLRWVTHELRQPLVVAVGYVSMLEEGSFGELPVEAGEVLRTVAERLDAMNVIIDGMVEDVPRRLRE